MVLENENPKNIKGLNIMEMFLKTSLQESDKDFSYSCSYF